ncbi:MAG: hypothetical protein GF411_08000 [Candidatus Lokiarchaeota archaeon]|nr:hypothetical protein [Candidatus Lokiarchaeota archaeon]
MKKEEYSKDTIEISYFDFLKEVYSGRIELIREMERVFGKDAVHNTIERYYEQRSVSSSSKMMEQEEPISTIEDFRTFLLKIDERPFMQKTMITEHPESDGKTVHRVVKQCMWADVFKELDASDIGDIMLCKTDFATASVFHPNVKLTRSKTLMAGDDCCDFIYSWEE